MIIINLLKDKQELRSLLASPEWTKAEHGGPLMIKSQRSIQLYSHQFSYCIISPGDSLTSSALLAFLLWCVGGLCVSDASFQLQQ